MCKVVRYLSLVKSSNGYENLSRFLHLPRSRYPDSDGGDRILHDFQVSCITSGTITIQTQQPNVVRRMQLCSRID
ncbi:hypothetical protein TWF225_009004 [Orbilia oligospora]|nr:hypothetical protein TWF225_009004 [Orbilia oligospora]KAF3281757.1 hypothetical protein TWF132_011170 [Orbilia oligospora]